MSGRAEKACPAPARRGRSALLPALAAVFLASCGRPAPAPRFDPALFSGERALERVRGLVEFSPRDSGTDGAAKAAEYLASQFRTLGLETEIDQFADLTPAGARTFRNVTGRIRGTGRSLVIIGSHYDTKAGIGGGFQGANDSGSSTGVLLEMAAVFKAGPRPSTGIMLVFFDGEECMRDYGPTDGFHGSRRLARKLVASGEAAGVVAVIVLDMVGDADLAARLPANGTPALRALVLAAAREEGAAGRFSAGAEAVGDDHAAFLEAGMPAVDIIDFCYGSAPGLNDYWHTPADTVDKLSARSLETAGRVAIRTVNLLQE